jgi:hypothetical protein
MVHRVKVSRKDELMSENALDSFLEDPTKQYDEGLSQFERNLKKKD